VAVALFDGLNATTPEEHMVEWPIAVKMLTKHDIRPDKTKGWLWSPVSYGPTKARAARNVAEVSCLVLDFDDGASPEELTPRWEEQKLEYVIHTTHSHMEDGKTPKWRAIFPLARPVPASEWATTYPKLFAHLAGGRADRACKDVSRIYYLPSCKPGAEAFAEHNKGRPLNPDEVPETTEKGERRSVVLPAEIPKGERNPTLWPWACSLRRKGLEEDEILARLRKENAARCKPPLPDEQVRGIAHRAAQYPRGEAGQGGRRSVATVLADLALNEGIELWHTPEKEQFATVWRDGHAEHWPLRSSAFHAWLAGLYYARTRHVAKDSAVKDARLALMARANEGQQVRAYTRVAEHEGAIYLDLADEEWRAVRIDAEGWEVVSNPPVRFRRSPGQDALPVPKPGGTLDELRTLINVTDEEWPLIAAWLLFAFRPDDDDFGDFPVLILGGQQGSAKSTISSILKRLIDPHDAELRSTIRSEHDLAIAARRSWVLALDNLSAIQLWMSDALCRLATGTAFTTRMLYTDDEEMVFRAKRPIILNGIGDLATRGDLLERALLITCPRIPEEARRAKEEFWKAFKAAWPRLLGAVLDCVCGALAELPKVELAGAPRMADFAIFATAAARAGAFGEKEFWDAYGASQADAHAIALEASPVAQAVLALLEDAGGGWKGTATGLLYALAGYVEPETRRLQAWPKSAKGLSKALAGLAENLRAVGVTVTRNRRGTAREIILTRRSDANGDASDANGDASDARGDANQGARSQAWRGFAPNSDASDAKMTKSNPLYTDDPRGEKKVEAAEEGSAKPGVENSKKCVTSVTSVTADASATPQNTEPDPVDDEIDNCACGRPAVRYSATGTPFCSECAEAGHQDPVGDSGESEVVL